MPRHERKTLVIKLVHRDKSETTAARVRSLWGEFKCVLSPGQVVGYGG